MIHIRKSSIQPLLFLLALLGGYACKDQGTDGTSVLKPAALQIVGGADQTGTENAELVNPLVVKVVDSAGHPVSGQLINFRVVAGGGIMFAGSSITNATAVLRTGGRSGFLPPIARSPRLGR